MLNLLLFAFLCCAVASSAAAALPPNEFDAWVIHHGKTYPSAAARDARRAAFEHNLKFVAFLNSKDPTATFAMTEFADLTQEEFRSSYLMPAAAPVALQGTVSIENASGNVTEWDWRTQPNVVTPVKNQGSAGTCWAFSATENIESVWALAGNSLTPLSVEQIVDCDNTKDAEHNRADCAVFGGWPYLAYQYVMRVGGLAAEQSYPYCAGDEKNPCFPCPPPGWNKTLCGPPISYCNATLYPCRESLPKAARIKGWAAIPSDESVIAQQLAATAPLSVALDAGKLQFYHHGIVSGSMCSKTELDHAVLMVGFGTEKDLLKSTDYWLVRNSWGAAWGENGYFRIARGIGACGINTQVTTAVV